MPPPYVTSPDPTEFTPQLGAMELTSEAAAMATLLTGQRRWMYPPLSGWSGDPSDIQGMNDAFNRSNLNNTYVQIVSDPNGAGTIGESMVVKLQVDYIAALERAFRTRHSSSIRAKLQAASRRRGQGDATNGVFAATVNGWLLRLIYAAHPTSADMTG